MKNLKKALSLILLLCSLAALVSAGAWAEEAKPAFEEVEKYLKVKESWFGEDGTPESIWTAEHDQFGGIKEQKTEYYIAGKVAGTYQYKREVDENNNLLWTESFQEYDTSTEKYKYYSAHSCTKTVYGEEDPETGIRRNEKFNENGESAGWEEVETTDDGTVITRNFTNGTLTDWRETETTEDGKTYTYYFFNERIGSCTEEYRVDTEDGSEFHYANYCPLSNTAEKNLDNFYRMSTTVYYYDKNGSLIRKAEGTANEILVMGNTATPQKIEKSEEEYTLDDEGRIISAVRTVTNNGSAVKYTGEFEYVLAKVLVPVEEA